MPHGGQHPTEETMNITRKFLGGELGTPGQVPGQPTDQGPAKKRNPGQQQGSLSNRFFDLPGPAGFAQTPQGQAILQRILGRGR